MTTPPAPEPHTGPLNSTDTSPAEHAPEAGAPAGCHSPELSRRAMLKASGAALVGGAAALAGLPVPAAQAARPSTAAGSLRQRPNILIILTDQERYPRHWPAGWADANLRTASGLPIRGVLHPRVLQFVHVLGKP